ncbi:MAG TPA: DNA-3-methyladenine glycosylase 2 family protein [Flavobacterium sp.]|jgi:DNA-3-methyladenine glycosylase II
MPFFIMQEAIDHLIQKDETLKYILETFGNPVILKREEGFASLCHIILEQQVSIASAKACYQKLEHYLGAVTPQILSHASDDTLKKCGISRQKILYIKDLAAKVIAKEIDFTSFASKSEEQVRKELIALKGVGNWSADVYLMFCLQSPDIVPLGDIAIKNTLTALYNCHTHEEMVAVSEQWKPFRTFASYTIWHYYLSKRNRI